MRAPLVGLVVCLSACATTPTVTAPLGPRVIQMEEVRIQTAVDPLVGLDAFDASDLLAKGNERFAGREFDVAIKIYDYLLTTFPTSELAPIAAYNAGLCYEGLAEHEQALARFQKIIREHPGSETARDAHYHACIALSKLDRWQEVADAFWEIRQKGDLLTMDELEARVGMGVAMFMMKDFDTAEREFMGAIRFHEEKSKTEYLDANYWLGQARFYTGEIYARRMENIDMASVSGDGESWKETMGKRLEEKCDLLMRAQNNFIRTIRAGHTGWATAAGFRIGSLYERLYDDMLAVKMPPDVPADAEPYYKELLEEKIGVLVNKAILVYERSLEMAARVGEQNEWVERTHRALERMKTLAVAAIRG